MISEDGAETSKLGDELAVVGSPLKLHDYLADLQLSPTLSLSSNVAVSSRQPVTSNDARWAMTIWTKILYCVSHRLYQ